jgi:hypothetical protein
VEEGKTEADMEEKGRRKDLKSGKDLERIWGLGPKQDPLEMLRGSPMLPQGLKGNKL